MTKKRSRFMFNWESKLFIVVHLCFYILCLKPMGLSLISDYSLQPSAITGNKSNSSHLSNWGTNLDNVLQDANFRYPLFVLYSCARLNMLTTVYRMSVASGNFISNTRYFVYQFDKTICVVEQDIGTIYAYMIALSFPINSIVCNF